MHSFAHTLSLLCLLFAAQCICSPLGWGFFPGKLDALAGTSTPSSPNRRLLARTPGDETVNPDAITGTTCGDPTPLNFHDTDVALLSICGGIAGTIEQCGGAPQTTTGASGTSLFTLTADEGATIVVSKGRWEGCVRAARAVCPGSFTSTCIGGVSAGAGFQFVLSANTPATSCSG